MTFTNGCPECAQLTGGRCALHTVQITHYGQGQQPYRCPVCAGKALKDTNALAYRVVLAEAQRDDARADLARLQEASEQVWSYLLVARGRLLMLDPHQDTRDIDAVLRGAVRLSTLIRREEATDAKVVAEAGDEEKWEPPVTVKPTGKE